MQITLNLKLINLALLHHHLIRISSVNSQPTMSMEEEEKKN